MITTYNIIRGEFRQRARARLRLSRLEVLPRSVCTEEQGATVLPALDPRVKNTTTNNNNNNDNNDNNNNSNIA